MNGSEDVVVLVGGLTIPREAVHVAIDLELRGMTLQAAGQALTVSPSARLTDEDRAAIRRWKLDLLALLAYDPPHPAWMQ